MGTFEQIKKDIVDAIAAAQGAGTKAYDTEASVVRTEGSTAWVHIPGGVDETPVRMTIHCEPGDTVQVRVAGGTAWLVGNETAPPTDDKTAIEARLRSIEASLAARQALAAAESATGLAQENASKMAAAVIAFNNDIENLQDQIDGNITTWYYGYEPTLSNEPASKWTTDEEKNNHIGDLFYNSETGYSYRFMLGGSSYVWVRISDEDISAALEAANEAQDTADHKRRVFITTPTVPYDIGDLWCEGASGDIKTAIKSRTKTQKYTASDWSKLNKYTDDTKANEAAQAAANAQKSADSAAQAAKDAWDHADDAASAAQTAWNHADDAANAAKTAWDHADEANNAATAAASAANAAGTAAANAKTAADNAQSSADDALSAANTANGAANSALTQLSIVEDVVDVLNWISEHGTYKATTDTKVVEGKYYFTRSGSSPNYTYSVVTNPTGNPKTKGYYELDSIDEAVSNYVSSHLALTNQGLWVINDSNSYKILLASDGMKVYDAGGNLVATYGESITFSSTRPQTIGNSSSYVKFYKDGSTWKLAISAQEIQLGSSSVATETYADGKASAAQTAAEKTAAGDATAKANAAQSAAEKTAAADATEKANKAEANAKADTLAKVTGFYATCPTAAGTKAKVATIVPAVTGWTLYTGATITVKFTAANTNSAPTLNVNGTGAKAIKTYANANLSEAEYKWSAGDTFTFVYNGTNWLMEDSTLITRVTTAETSITQTKSQIELKANASDVYTKTDVDGKISQEVKERDAAIKISAEGISSEVSKISSAKYINSAASGWTLANIKSYATEGKSTTFNVDDTSGLRVGDTVYIKGTDTTRDCTVYVKVTVTAIPSTTKVTGTGHGYEDVLPVDTIKSTINQSSDSVKIQAKHVEIDGAAIFSNSDFRAAADAAYDEIGAASTAETNAKNAIPTKVSQLTNDSKYGTTTQIATAKSEAISAAASDATSKADAAQAAAEKTAAADATAKANAAQTAAEKTAKEYTDTVRSWYATSSTAAEQVAKVATITPTTTTFKLAVGTIVNVEFTNTNSAAVASVTLNVNGTGAKNIKNMYNNTRSNIPAVGYLVAGIVYQFMYDGDYWTIQNLHYNTNTNYYDRRLHNNYILAAGAVAAGALACGTSAGYKQIAAGITFDLSYPILLAIAAWTSGTQYANGYEAYPSMNPATTGTVQAIALNATVYLKGTISGNTFTIASSNFLTCTIPTSEDGFFYIPLGVVANDATTKMYFASSKDLYAYIDGKFRQVTPTEVVASQRIYYRSSVDTKPTAMPTAWVTETGDKYATNATTAANWSTKVTPISSDKTSATATKYLYLWTCEQRKRLDGTLAYTNVLLDDSTTVIDGGNIVTGTVTANQIAAGAVTAEKIKAGEITADKLNATDINASGTLTVGAFNAEIKSTILNSNRNLIVGTRIPDVSAANRRPHILNQQTNTAISSGTLTEAEHGVRITSVGAVRPYIRFGINDAASDSSGMNGLEAGKTYTISFDSTWKVLSGTTETTTRYMTVWFYDNSADAATFANTAYKRFGTVTQANRGTEMNGRCEFTFTVPEATTKTYILIANNRTTANNYAAGDFIEIRNLKLEEGSVATPWSYAPEDVDDAIAASSAALAASINESIDDVTKAMTNGFSDIDETLSSQAGAIASQATSLSDLTGVVDGQGSSISQMNGTLTNHTNSISALEATQANINGWMQFDPTATNPALIIGRNGSQMTTRIFNDKLSFYDGGDEVAYVGSNQLHIKNAEIENNLQIGSYLFKPHSNGDGGMSLVWAETNNS